MADNELSTLYERNSNKIKSTFHEGFGSAVSSAAAGAIGGAIGGAITGGARGKRAANKVVNNQPVPQTTAQPQMPADSPIGPKPAYMPTANGPQPQSTTQQQPKAQNLLGKAAQGIGNMVKGGVEKAQQAKQQRNDTNAFMSSLSSGAAATQNRIQDPAGAQEYAQNVLNAFTAIADAIKSPQQESSLALAWFEYAHITERKMSADEVLNAIAGFANVVKGKTADQLSDNERQTFLKLAQQIPMIVQTLQKNGAAKNVLQSSGQFLLSADAETLAQAFQTMQKAAEQQGSQLSVSTKPNQLNGAIANAIKGIDDSQMQSLLNATRLIINKYGQVEDFTVYAWSDLEDLVDALKEFGSPVDIDLSGIQDPENTTPSGNPPAKKSAQQPQQVQQPGTAEVQSEPQAEETLDPKEIKQAVGDIYKRVKDDPVAIKTLLQKAFEKPANRDEFYRRYNLNPPDLS